MSVLDKMSPIFVLVRYTKAVFKLSAVIRAFLIVNSACVSDFMFSLFVYSFNVLVISTC